MSAPFNLATDARRPAHRMNTWSPAHVWHASQGKGIPQSRPVGAAVSVATGRLDQVMFVLTLLALVVAALSLSVTWWQLRLQRNVAGGRGIIPGLFSYQTSVNGETHIDFEVYIELVGPGIRHEMQVHLERDGQALSSGDDGYVKSPPVRKSMSCDSDPIKWKFTLTSEDAEDVWCIISWVEPRGDEVWTNAYARALTGEDQLWEWRWKRFRKARQRKQDWSSEHGPKWFRRRLGGVKPLGRWRPHVNRSIQPGHGPINNGRAPDLSAARKCWRPTNGSPARAP